MIKVLNAFQHSPNLELLIKQDWVIVDNKIDTSFIKKSYPLYDECSLELGLKLKDQANEHNYSLKLDALSIDNNINHIVVKNLYALGYETIYNLTSNSLDEQISTYIDVFNKHLENNQYDLIMCGLSSNIDEGMQLPYYLATKLNYPCFSNVVATKLIDEQTINITYQIDNLEINEEVKLPAVICIGNALNTYLRVATLKSKLACKNKEIIVENYDDIIDNKTSTLVNMEINDLSKQGIILDQELSLQQQVAYLYDNYLSEDIQ